MKLKIIIPLILAPVISACVSLHVVYSDESRAVKAFIENATGAPKSHLVEKFDFLDQVILVEGRRFMIHPLVVDKSREVDWFLYIPFSLHKTERHDSLHCFMVGLNNEDRVKDYRYIKSVYKYRPDISYTGYKPYSGYGYWSPDRPYQACVKLLWWDKTKDPGNLVLLPSD